MVAFPPLVLSLSFFLFLQAALVYSEGIIICQYAYLVPARLGCHVLSLEAERRWAAGRG